MGDAAAEWEWLLPLGCSLYALRQILRGSSDAGLALQYLFFHLDVNDPQITPLLERHGVPAAAAPPLEDYVSEQLRPWMRQIDRGEARAASWAAAARSWLAAAVMERNGIEEWALRILAAELDDHGAQARETWRLALHEGRDPGPDAARLIGAIGILQEGCGVMISTAAATPWKIEKGAGK